MSDDGYFSKRIPADVQLSLTTGDFEKPDEEAEERDYATRSQPPVADALDQAESPGGFARTRSGDPATSYAAAASVGDLRASQKAVYDTLALIGPMIDEELVAVYDRIPRQSESGLRTRRAELVDAGLVVDSGERRPTVGGRPSIVWRVA